MLGVFYIGQDRFSDRTRDNHAWILEQLKSRFGTINTYDFLQPGFDRSDCPTHGNTGSAGGLQVWDFMKAVQLVYEPCVMKLRTDVWFANSSLDPLLKAVERCVLNAIDVAYLGSNVKIGFENVNDTKPAHQEKKVPDFVIVARREAVLDIDRVRNHLSNSSDVASGNRVFKIITENLNRSETTWCRIFLVRRDRTMTRDWNIAWDFASSYPKSSAASNFLSTCRPDQPL